MNAPRWARALLHRLAPPDRAEDLVGDLEEAHVRRVGRYGRTRAHVVTAFETLDVAWMLLRGRWRGAGVSALDLKLGARMLAKHPGLTVVGGLAMAFGIWVGALSFEAVRQIVSPDLPLEDGSRIVGLQTWDTRRHRPALPYLEDFAAWRDQIRSVEDLAAFRTVERNVIVDGGVLEPVLIAEITATGLGVARVPPLLGRTLLETDEAPGAPSVVVLGYYVWQSRFAGDPSAIGRTVAVGSETSTVVGVMPEGFTFPLSHHAWVPLRRSAVDLEPGEGGRVAVFGRLAEGAKSSSVEAELTVVLERRAALHPDALAHLRPRVLPYARSVRPLPDIGPVGLAAANVFTVMLLVLVCGNVALLTFARAAARERELTVRSALGAGRARIVSQLFAEALVLGTLAAFVGLLFAGIGMRWYVAMLEADSGGLVPFWTRRGLSPVTVVYAGLLTILAAAVVGVVPGLKVTGRAVGGRLKEFASGTSSLRFGGVWTAVIVVQIAVTVAFPATALAFHRYVHGIRSLDLGFAAEEYLSARLEVDDDVGDAGMDADTPASTRASRLGDLYRDLAERLSNEPNVTGVTFASRLPGAIHRWPRVQVEGDVRWHRVGVARVDPAYFEVLGVPVDMGRSFAADDLEADAAAVLVNRAFVDEILGGRNALGRRVRYMPGDPDDPGRWFKIVGVAENLGIIGDGGGDFYPRLGPGLYHPLAPGGTYPLEIAIHTRGAPEALAQRLRVVSATVDPGLRVHEVRTLDRISESQWRESEFLYRLLGGISLVALLLSLSGVFSVMAFTVSRRTREIGVRVALGSRRTSIFVAIFRRPLLHVAAGIGVGGALVGLLTMALTGPLSLGEAGEIGLYALVMWLICMAACVGPTRRALAVQPTEALRAEG